MKRRSVEIAKDARADLMSIGDYVAKQSSVERAAAYVRRIENYCLGLEYGAERGQLRNEIRPGLRTVGFENSVTIAFVVLDEFVVVMRIFGRGLDWTRDASLGPDETS